MCDQILSGTSWVLVERTYVKSVVLVCVFAASLSGLVPRFSTYMNHRHVNIGQLAFKFVKSSSVRLGPLSSL